MIMQPYSHGWSGTSSIYASPPGGDLRSAGDLNLLRRAQVVNQIRKDMRIALRRHPTSPGIPLRGALPRLVTGGGKLAMLYPPLRNLNTLLNLLELMSDPLYGPHVQGGYTAALEAAGWSPICDVGGVKAYAAWAPNDPNLTCDPLAVDVPFLAYGETLPAVEPFSRSWIEFGQNNDIGVVGRMGRNEQWNHPNSPPSYEAIPFTPGQPGYYLETPRFLPFPLADLPDFTPVPTDGGTPVQLAPPPQVFGRQRPQIKQWPQAPGRIYPRKQTQIRLRPYERPASRTWFRGPPVPPIVILAPPKKGEKEQKVQLWTSAMQFIQSVFHGITEVDDFVDALSKGLPKELQINGTVDEKIANLYKNFDAIKWGTAIEEVIKNEIIDRAVGGMLGGANRGLRSATAKGYGTGGGGRINMYGRAAVF